jgi:transposase
MVVVEDESIFNYETKIRAVWAVKGSRPFVLTTGSHIHTVWFGSLAEDGTQLFRQYPNANSDSFLDYMNYLRRKYPKMILFLDKATYHRKEKRVIVYLEKHRKTIRVRWFPTGFSEANPIEECWRQGKDTILGSTLPQSLEDLKEQTTKYYRTKRFKLDLYKYLCH